MRVLLASLHPRAFSGQVHSLRALARVVGSRGHDVRTITVSIPESPRRLPSSVHYLASTLKVVRSIARDVDGADLVHLNLPTPGFSLLADWLAARIPVPLVVGFEAPLISRELLGSVAAEARHQPIFYLPRLLINNPLVARAARYRAAAYVVSSEYQRRQIERIGTKAPISVIPNVVELPNGIGPGMVYDGRDLARQRLGLPDTDPLVGYVGHFHPVKGVETLGRAFAELHRRVPNARLALAWSGLGDSEAMARLLSDLGCLDHAIFLGRTNLVDLLRAIDVLALPYRYPIGQNSFPNVLLEAQGVGVPLVTTNIPVVAEACQAPGTAILVQPGDTSGLAVALASLIEDPSRRAEMVRRQRAHFASRFAPETLAIRYERLYRGVLVGELSAEEGREEAPASTTEQAIPECSQ
jgi:glycosyltransferase involved in cell wall biosynthesis